MRLGYACINTLLPTSSRTVRLANATHERLLELTEANLVALQGILRWNRTHGVRIFRVSSDVVPLGSHPANRTRWWETLGDRLGETGVLAEGMRLSMHPGQYTLLGSPRPEVTAAALADLEYHARLLGSLGAGPDAKTVIHLGGVYGDRDRAAERICTTAERLSDEARSRLAVEHDERWTLAETLEVAGRIGAPVVFDAFHHELNPSLSELGVRDALLCAAATWQRADGPPEVHFSTQHPGKRPGAHADTLDLVAFARFSAAAGDLDIDCVLEVKDKEQSVLRAMRSPSATVRPPGSARGSTPRRAARAGTRGRRS